MPILKIDTSGFIREPTLDCSGLTVWRGRYIWNNQNLLVFGSSGKVYEAYNWHRELGWRVFQSDVDRNPLTGYQYCLSISAIMAYCTKEEEKTIEQRRAKE